MFYVKAKRALTEKAPSIEDTAAKLKRLGVSDDKAEASGKRNQLKPTEVNPLNRNHSASQNPVVGSATDPDTLHVLVVEDNLINQQVFAKQLRQKGCIVHIANHGADALLALKKSTFAKDSGPHATPLSLVLLDLEMPVMDGLTCIKKIREWQKSGVLTRPVPVIAVWNCLSKSLGESSTDMFHRNSGYSQCQVRTSRRCQSGRNGTYNHHTSSCQILFPHGISCLSTNKHY